MSTPDYETNRKWMAELPEELTKVRLCHLAIPGSHDSGTFYLDKSLGIAVDQSTRRCLRVFGLICCCVRNIVYNWSVTQTLNFTQQLQLGIRYFDLRVAFHADSKQARFVHGLYGLEIVPAMAEVKQFLEENKQEVVILDFNHMYNMDTGAHCSLVLDLNKIFGDLLLPPNKFENCDLTLENIWKFGGDHRVIIFYHHVGDVINQDIEAAKCGKFWSMDRIISPWPHTNNESKMCHFLVKNLSKDDGWFYVSQGILTPGCSDITCGLCSRIQKLASRGTTAFTNWLQGKTEELKEVDSVDPDRINICVVDFVEESDYVSNVLALNDRKRRHNTVVNCPNS